jgi:hypothetical protein
MSADTVANARWGEVQGRVLRSEVDYDGEHFLPVVEYEYTVDGAHYRGDAIFVGPLIRFNWKGPAKRMTARFPVGAVITVYADSADPRRSSLHPRTDPNLPAFVVFFVLFLIVFGILALGAFLQR